MVRFHSISLLALLLLLAPALRAQSFDADASRRIMAKSVDAIGNVASSLISDSLTPMTHFDEGEWNATLVPAWFKVRTAYDDPSIDGKGLNGGGLGLGGAYALSDRIMLYGACTWMGMDGGLKGRMYGTSVDTKTVDVEYNLVSFFFGGGYDLFDGNGPWSAPLYAGLSLQWYGVDINYPVLSVTTPLTGTVDMKGEGSGVLAGVTAGIAVSREFLDLFRITPYFLFMADFNKPSVESTITGSLYPVPVKSTVEGDPVVKGMLGLSLSLLATKSLTFSFSVGGMLTSATSFYNNTFLDGLDMVSVVFSVTYNGGIRDGQNGGGGEY